MVKNPLAIQETQVQSLSQEDPLGMATYSSILAWKTPWTEEPGGLQSLQSQSCRHREQTYGHSEGRSGWDKLREKHGNTYITTCKIDSGWWFALWLRELKPRLCDNSEGWDRVGGGREVQEGGYMYSYGYTYVYHTYTYGWFMLMYGRNQHNIVKKLSSN